MNIKTINEWEVLTPTGWSDFKAVSKLTKECYVIIKFIDGTYIKCSENHKLKLSSGIFVYAKSIKKGMEFAGKDVSQETKDRISASIKRLSSRQ